MILVVKELNLYDCLYNIIKIKSIDMYTWITAIMTVNELHTT